jgi:hypothetical protein
LCPQPANTGSEALIPVPFGLILELSGRSLTLAWAVEILLGITGIAIAGSQFAGAVKLSGWRGAPIVACRTMIHGKHIGEEA